MQKRIRGMFRDALGCSVSDPRVLLCVSLLVWLFSIGSVSSASRNLHSLRTDVAFLVLYALISLAALCLVVCTHRTMWNQLAEHLQQSRNVYRYLLVQLTGLAVALFLWLCNSSDLSNFILHNQMESIARIRLLIGSLTLMLTFLFGWISLSILLALNDTTSRLDHFLRFTSNFIIPAALLPFLPVLGVQRLERDFPVLAIVFIFAFCVPVFFLIKSSVVRTESPAARADEDKASIRGLAITLAAVLAYITYFTVLTFTRHASFKTAGADLGIFNQLLYNTLHRGLFRTTLCGTIERNFLAIHVSPIHLLLVPFYALYRDPKILLLVQSVALGAAAVPLYLIARRRLHGTIVPAIFAICYLLYPAIHGANIRDFHETPIATPLILFMLLFLETRRDRLYWVFLILTLMVKEDLALSCFVIGIHAALSHKRQRLGLATCAISLAYFILCIGVIMPMHDGSAMTSRFDGYLSPGFTGLKGIVATLLTNPFFTLRFALFDMEKIVFLLQILGPVLFLALATGKGVILLAPGLATALLASDSLHYSIGVHYPAVIAPFVFYLTILALEKVSITNRKALAGVLLAAALLFNYQYGWFFSKRSNGFDYPRQQYERFLEITRDIPQSAGVSASNPLIPHLSSRERIYYFPYVGDADYIVFYTVPTAHTFWPETRESAFNAIVSIVRRGTFGVVRFDGDFLLLKRGAPSTKNQSTVHRLIAKKNQH